MPSPFPALLRRFAAPPPASSSGSGSAGASATAASVARAAVAPDEDVAVPVLTSLFTSHAFVAQLRADQSKFARLSQDAVWGDGR